MIAAFSTVFGIIFMLCFIILCVYYCDSPAADDANDQNMFALQPMPIIPNGNAFIAGQIEWYENFAAIPFDTNKHVVVLTTDTTIYTPTNYYLKINMIKR